MQPIASRLLFLAAALLLCVATPAADPNAFVDFSVEGLPGRLYVPPEASESRRPVIVFLHGLGETGDDNRRQVNHNIDNLLKSAKQRGAFLYAPQAVTRGWGERARTDQVVAQLESLLGKHNADPSRVYLTGLSMGGGGAWTVASRYPQRFAAAAPICGVPPADDWDPALQLKTPTWAFHARDDGAVPVRCSHERINALLAAAGKPPVEFPSEGGDDFSFSDAALNLHYTEYPTGGHAIWGKAYATPEAIEWLFSQQQATPKAQ
ncbi:Esterase PHB depolymerase [Pirellulimonas nuda]|uniref:Esterase PHB depolymerase n=1 Tax=Pirellulimonas nuda TaxID=2528009 RepID=A0A518D6H7_9BACT|nr:alpha/beta fold hydrolase [Pirellulimonas nuda]QDU87049.1 Esterase PHB depolymerase [Pirellulimonas nuda]